MYKVNIRHNYLYFVIKIILIFNNATHPQYINVSMYFMKNIQTMIPTFIHTYILKYRVKKFAFRLALLEVDCLEFIGSASSMFKVSSTATCKKNNITVRTKNIISSNIFKKWAILTKRNVIIMIIKN